MQVHHTPWSHTWASTSTFSNLRSTIWVNIAHCYNISQLIVIFLSFVPGPIVTPGSGVLAVQSVADVGVSDRNHIYLKATICFCNSQGFLANR